MSPCVRALAVGLGAAVMGVVFAPSPIAQAASASVLALSDLSHSLDGPNLIVTGFVVNLGHASLSRLVVDVRGFAPSGDLTTFGSDGIPWTLPPGSAERFSVSVPIPPTLIRDYTVTVGDLAGPPLAGVSRRVDSALYRSFVLSRVRVAASVHVGRLIVSTDVGGMPVTQLTVEATLIVVNPKVNLLQNLTVVVPADAAETFRIDGVRAALVSVRVVDMLLSAIWDL